MSGYSFFEGRKFGLNCDCLFVYKSSLEVSVGDETDGLKDNGDGMQWVNRFTMENEESKDDEMVTDDDVMKDDFKSGNCCNCVIL